MPPEEEKRRSYQAHRADQGQVLDELAEGQPGIGADEDVGRVADQGGGAADVRGKGLGDQQGQGVDLQGDRDLDGHRQHQQHGGDVVQKGGDDRGDYLEDERQHKDIAFGQGIGLKGQELKHAGLFHHPHEDHHAHEQEDDVEVDGPHGVVKREDIKRFIAGPQGIGDEQDEGRAQEGHQGAVHQLQRNDHIDQQQDEGGDPEARGDGAVQGEVLGRLEELVALGVGPGLHHLHRGGRDGLPGGLGGLDLHLGGRAGSPAAK